MRISWGLRLLVLLLPGFSKVIPPPPPHTFIFLLTLVATATCFLQNSLRTEVFLYSSQSELDVVAAFYIHFYSNHILFYYPCICVVPACVSEWGLYSFVQYIDLSNLL